jgi:hypothetical protein
MGQIIQVRFSDVQERLPGVEALRDESFKVLGQTQ